MDNLETLPMDPTAASSAASAISQPGSPVSIASTLSLPPSFKEALNVKDDEVDPGIPPTQPEVLPVEAETPQSPPASHIEGDPAMPIKEAEPAPEPASNVKPAKRKRGEPAIAEDTQEDLKMPESLLDLKVGLKRV